MPKIDVNRKLFFELLGRDYDRLELERALTNAKAELDEMPEESLPADKQVIKIELNDTNRPDLWSTAGLARLLRVHAGGKSNAEIYKSFLSVPAHSEDCGERVVKVDAALEEVRPFAAGFVISGKKIDSFMLDDIIQTQEKLCRNFGRKRKTAAMGVYRSQLIKWPVFYKAAEPDETKFIPLGFDGEMSCRRILKEHPKGIEYGALLEGKKVFPIFEDSAGEILSMPPIINSAKLGAVEAGDSELFVELTGTDMPSLLLAVNIVACDFADAGYKILPVKFEHPYETGFGKNITTPFYFQIPAEAECASVNRLLGTNFSDREITEALRRMDCESYASAGKITVNPPPYRNDFLHEVDIIEDVMLGKTVDFFKPETPDEFTIGRLTPATELSRKIKKLMAGMGYQEMIFNYLGSKKDYIEKMLIDGKNVIEISNPMSENYQFVRPSIIPSLMGAEENSAGAVYPHKIFEIGKIAFLCSGENTGTRTVHSLGFLTAEQSANYNAAASEIANLLYYLNVEYKVEETHDPRFIDGRQAGIIARGKQIGVFGEINPQVLENWSVPVPCFAGELNIEELLCG